jgi:hypothetical protein
MLRSALIGRRGNSVARPMATLGPKDLCPTAVRGARVVSGKRGIGDPLAGLAGSGCMDGRPSSIARRRSPATPCHGVLDRLAPVLEETQILAGELIECSIGVGGQRGEVVRHRDGGDAVVFG